jgi:hypothetical protein
MGSFKTSVSREESIIASRPVWRVANDFARAIFLSYLGAAQSRREFVRIRRP